MCVEVVVCNVNVVFFETQCRIILTGLGCCACLITAAASQLTDCECRGSISHLVVPV